VLLLPPPDGRGHGSAAVPPSLGPRTFCRKAGPLVAAKRSAADLDDGGAINENCTGLAQIVGKL
jgi:hypothetical protein